MVDEVEGGRGSKGEVGERRYEGDHFPVRFRLSAWAFSMLTAQHSGPLTVIQGERTFHCDFCHEK
jgi:hypothetical protein